MTLVQRRSSVSTAIALFRGVDMKRLIYDIAFALLLLAWPPLGRGSEGLSVFEPVGQRSHTREIRSSRVEYAVDVGGTVDMDNTTTRLYETFRIAFQNNVSLTLANTGNTTVKNPRIITNGKRRWWCMEELLREILAEASNDQEKAFLIYDFVGNAKYFNDEGYDPFEQKKVATRKRAEAVEKEEVLEEQIPEHIVKQFVTIPLGKAPDKWVYHRAW